MLPSSRCRPHCKVRNCKELHWRHYCVFCRDSDSSHFSANCQRKSPEYKARFWDACALVVFNRRTNTFLLQHRSPRMRNGSNLLGLISGRKETREIDPLDTAFREAWEEFFGNTLTREAFEKQITHVRKLDSTHIYTIVVDRDEDWAGSPECMWELSDHVFPTGHMWVTYEQLRDLVYNNGAVSGIRMWPYRKHTFRCIWKTIYHLRWKTYAA